MATRTLKEKISIKGGFGPLKQHIELEISPITVFIGSQGSGKSLISQLLYFFRDAKYLLSQNSDRKNYSDAIRSVVEGIRGGGIDERTLCSFVTGQNAQITYTSEQEIIERSISVSGKKHQIMSIKPFSEEVRNWFDRWFENPSEYGKIRSKAIFVPAEGTFISRFISCDQKIFTHDALPLTMREILNVLNKADDIYQKWRSDPSKKPKQIKFIEKFIWKALKGEAIPAPRERLIRKWLWYPENSKQSIDIGMASSGQMNIWPLVFSVYALFGSKKEERALFIHVEEPETHLHPAAQVEIAKFLAYLANQGIRIVVTTHSLTILYALNNLTLAYQKLKKTTAERVPDIPFRIPRSKICAYLLDVQHGVQKIIDNNGQIDESLLGKVLGDLQVEFNRLMAYKILWGEE